MSSLNLKAIRVGRGINASLLEDAKKAWLAKQKDYEENGQIVGYRLEPVENMSWLGVGHMAVPGGTDLDGDYWMNFLNEYGPRLVNNGKYFPVFQSLHRSATLTSKCRIVTSSQEAQDKIRRIWNGENISFYFRHHAAGWAVGVVETDSNKSIMRYTTFTESSRRAEWRYSYDVEIEEDDTQILILRIMHCFLRLFSYVLPNHALDELLRLLETGYRLRAKKYKADLMDVAILRADLYLNVASQDKEEDEHVKTELRNRLSHVGCALVAMGRFGEAAPLFAEIGEVFLDFAPEALYLAGVAFFIDGNEDEALSCQAKNIGYRVQNNANPDLSNPTYARPLEAIISCYFAKFEKSMRGWNESLYNWGRNQRKQGQRRYLVLTEEDNVAIGSVALLSAANPEFGHFAGMFGLRPGIQLSQYLKRTYRHAAKEVVVNSMKSGCIEEYERVFCDCMDPRLSIPVQPKFDANASDTYRPDMIKWLRKRAVDCLKCREIPICVVCGTADSPLFSCPCKSSVSYCSRDCQVQHWKFHKREHQENMKENAGQGML